MPDYGVNATSLSAPQGAGASVITPVRTDTSLFSAIADAAMGAYNKKQQSDAEQLKMAVLGDYSKKLNAINQGIATGELNASKASALTRSLNSEYQASNPQFTDDFRKILDFHKGGSDIGDAEKQVADERELRKTQLSDATKNGWVVLPGMAPQQQDNIINANAHATKVEKELASFYRKKEYERSQGTYDQNKSDRERRELTIQLLNESAGLHLEAFNTVGMKLVSDVGSGKNPQEAMTQLSQQFADIRGKITATSGLHPELAGAYTSIFTDLNVSFEKALNPATASEMSVKALQNQFDAIMLKAKIIAVGDPTVRASAVNNVLLSNNVAAQLHGADASTIVFNKIATADEKNPAMVQPIVGNPEVESKVYAMVKEGLSKALKGEISDKNLATLQAGNTINHLLKETGALVSNPGMLNPKALSGIMDLFASPEFAQASKQGMLNAESRTAVQKVFEIGMMQKAAPVLDKTLAESIKGLDGAPMQKMDMFDLQVSGAGIKFVRMPVTATSPLMNIPDMTETERAINKLIRIGTHLEGGNDYKKFWENNRYKILPSLYGSPEPLPMGHTVKTKDGATYKYLGGPDRIMSNWELVNVKQ